MNTLAAVLLHTLAGTIKGSLIIEVQGAFILCHSFQCELASGLAREAPEALCACSDVSLLSVEIDSLSIFQSMYCEVSLSPRRLRTCLYDQQERWSLRQHARIFGCVSGHGSIC